MCFGGGGGGGGGAAPVVNVAQPVSKQFEIPRPEKLDPQYRSLIAEETKPGVRMAGEKRRRAKSQSPMRQSLSTGKTGMSTGINLASAGGSSPAGGVNL
jgi:hypothetical protein